MQTRKPVIELDSPFMNIACSDEFSQLTQSEKMYAYHFYKAAWEGAKICFFQKSYESPALFLLFQLIYQQPMPQLKESASAKGISSEDFQRILAYSSGVLTNCGNFRSFGDTKFVPDVSEEVFQKFIEGSRAFETHKELVEELWNSVKHLVFDYSDKNEKIGLDDTGFSGYYSSNITKDEAKMISEFLQVVNISELNTRLVKTEEKEFLILLGSANTRFPQTHIYQGNRIKIVYGDFSNFLRRTAAALIKALPYAANLSQKRMIKAYVEHFLSGDIETHKESQRHWVKDIGPIIETNIGFIETYLDPIGVRAEFEGFVAVVNKKLSEKVGLLVANAEKLLQQSPWPKDFEKDTFLKPDFTSLAVLTFASSGTPLGINIPNYDDIRQEEGFKNVFLGNCLPKLKKINFLSEEDSALMLKYFEVSAFQKVSYHELLGHGCGKLFQETDDGLNFDINTVVNPLTGEKIKSWYKANETWNQKFGSLSNPYEECRADSVALYFSAIREACEILSPEYLEHFDDVCYTSWLGFVHTGVASLEFFIPGKTWGQAHCKGRFVILRVLLEAGEDFVQIKKTKNENGQDWLHISMDRSKINSVGMKAMKKFLTRMMVYKSTADLESATAMFEGYAQVDEFFLDVRRIVVENKKPRRIEIQAHLNWDGKDAVKYESFEDSFEGVIQGYMSRYPYFDQEMLDLWREYRELYKH